MILPQRHRKGAASGVAHPPGEDEQLETNNTLGRRPALVHPSTLSIRRESYMYEVLNEVYLQIFFTDGCNFAGRI